ncbi:Ferredoxin-type protein NapG [Thermoflexales bacterium]|nr:Ferredoxin-type protein NapG [Thermoflexales bacterium]
MSARKPLGRWITARKVVQIAALLFVIALLIMTRRGGWPPDLVNLLMRLDPLTVLAQSLSSRSFLLGSAVVLLTLLLTVIAGRAWCGWLCPLGTVLDLIPLRKRTLRDKQPAISNSWRSVKYGLLIAILVAALLGNLTLLIFDPLTIFIRTFTTSLWPAADQIVTSLETTLYRVPFLSDPISALDGWLRPAIFPSQPVYYRDAWLFGAVFVGIIALNLIAPRLWCRYLCPLGGLLGWISRGAWLRREVAEECKGCTLCTSVCPTGTIDATQHYVSDPAECTLCLECLDVCPRSTIAFQLHRQLAPRQAYDPSRRQFLAAATLAIGGVALFQSDATRQRVDDHLIRPPGVIENDLLDQCIRCGECVRACPTHGLQPALTQAGLQGVWTPLLVPRLGYCDYSCNACGQVCPVAAIPPLNLDDKRTRVIGKAYLDDNRCIAWADHRDCIVCEEMCPLPEKAIYLEKREFADSAGSTVTVQVPHVERDKCIGCGICEFKCPLNGEAAIRVFVPGAEAAF